MRHNTFFSIVIPAHNEEKTISTTLQAIAAQTYTNFEVIVVDNLSTDTTAQIVEQFTKTDRRVRLISCNTKGILYARDAGYRTATGDIIVQLDANAYPKNNDWLVCANKHFLDERIIALAGTYDFYDAVWMFRLSAIVTQWIIFPILNWFVQKTKRGGLLIGGNAFIRTSVLYAIDGYPVTTTLFWFEDLITACAIVQYGWIATVGDIVVKKSARRYIKHGYIKTQRSYNKGTQAVLFKKPFPKEPAILSYVR
jgi:glycosyltransferase involved in cell wall biosynthesis